MTETNRSALEAPILFLVFNRPDNTRAVLEQIRKARPGVLYVAADGPRPDIEGEAEACQQVRQLVLSGITWPCELKTLLRDTNLGCRLAVSSAIDWFFKHVEEGIILEDDCLPDVSFFCFCQELLRRYREDCRVMMICGNNFQPVSRGNCSYFFSRYLQIWGWATWRRAWSTYDVSMRGWPHFRKRKEMMAFMQHSTARRARRMFDDASKPSYSAWDAQWCFACWSHQGLCIMPRMNLVTNIGSTGTHMKVYDPQMHVAAHCMPFPLQHPQSVCPDEDADRYTEQYVFLRTWVRTLYLIVRYLYGVACRNPLRLPEAIRTIGLSILAEAHRRWRLWVGANTPAL